MRKYSQYLILALGILSLPAMEPSCDGNVDLTVTITTPIPFFVNSAESSYAETIRLDITTSVENAMADAEFDSTGIKDILVESIQYTIIQNSSQRGTIGSFDIRIGEDGETNPADLLPLISDTNIDLDAAVDVVRTPQLGAAGISFLKALLIRAFVDGEGPAAFTARLVGQASPAPPPNITFFVQATVTLTIVADVAIDP